MGSISLIVSAVRDGSLFKGLDIVLSAVQNQTELPEELIIVTNYPKQVQNLLETGYWLQPTRIIEYSKLGCPAAVRNEGAKHAQHEWLVFLDDDTLLSPAALSTLRISMMPHSFLCGAERYWLSEGRSLPVVRHTYFVKGFASLVKDFCERVVRVDEDTGYRTLEDFTYLSSFGAVERRQFWSVSGFDEKYVGWGWEDVDLMMRLLCVNTRCDLLGAGIRAIHLDHPRISRCLSASAIANKKRFEWKQQLLGVRFKCNHLFGIYENDGSGVLWKI